MKPVIFAYPRRTSMRDISRFGDWFLTLRFISDDPDWIRTRISEDNLIEACGISRVTGDLKYNCYNSGGFWEGKYDSFEWRSRTVSPKTIHDSAYL